MASVFFRHRVDVRYVFVVVCEQKGALDTCLGVRYRGGGAEQTMWIYRLPGVHVGGGDEDVGKSELPVNTGCREIKTKKEKGDKKKKRKAETLGGLSVCGLPADSSLTSGGSVERCGGNRG